MQYIIAGDPNEVGAVMETVRDNRFLSDAKNVTSWNIKPLTEGVVWGVIDTSNTVNVDDLKLLTSEYTSLTIGVADGDGFVEKVVAETDKIKAGTALVQSQTEGVEAQNVERKIMADFFESAEFMAIAKNIGLTPSALSGIIRTVLGGLRK